MLNITHHQRNVNQNHNEILPHTCQKGQNQNHEKQQVLVRMWRKKNPLVLLVGMQTHEIAVENRVGVPQKSYKLNYFIIQELHYWVFTPKIQKH